MAWARTKFPVDNGPAFVVRAAAPSGNRDEDQWRVACDDCPWTRDGNFYSNRTIEGKQLAFRDAREHIASHRKAVA